MGIWDKFFRSSKVKKKDLKNVSEEELKVINKKKILELLDKYELHPKQKYHLEESKGLTSLDNLGNTGYMNTAIQCLSNTIELTEFFLLSENFKNYINTVNPIGSEGKVVCEYVDLLGKLWVKKRNSIAPREFQRLITSLLPQVLFS